MLQATDLSKRYEDGLLALDHLNLEVKEGEIFCLLGANGAGKTTSINLILPPGRILIFLPNLAAKEISAKRITICLCARWVFRNKRLKCV